VTPKLQHHEAQKKPLTYESVRHWNLIYDILITFYIFSLQHELTYTISSSYETEYVSFTWPK